MEAFRSKLKPNGLFKIIIESSHNVINMCGELLAIIVRCGFRALRKYEPDDRVGESFFELQHRTVPATLFALDA
ncbi:hypothetical protein WN51_00909 [Melipona quadrifasciata]|uniref:Uncharacterized protein n=1 Tax=Melipona quadrifasciata TaxID=166423 RepID=A0A0N0BES4_9HYME|nr:hypothetical protein WN51_00909 [Melipona quadrifasciata]